MLLAGCVSTRPVAITKADAKAMASFCAVAEYQPVNAGDSVDTQAQKASNNAKGEYLKCEWAVK